MNTETEDALSALNLKPFSSWRNGLSPEGWFPQSLGESEAGFYQRNGFLVLDRALSDGEVDAICVEAARLCRNADGQVGGIAASPAEASDDEIMRDVLCIHFPHKLSPLMHQTLSHPRVVQALTTIIGPNVKCMQSMMFFKAAGKPGQAWHQDEDYIPTRDRSLTGVWIAMDDATVENGCLWVIPGSHRPGVLWKMEWHGDRRFDCALESQGFPYTTADEVPVEVKKGSVVLFNGYTLHRSLPNHAKAGYRRALVNHYMSAESLLPWRRQEGVTIAMHDFRDVVLVAGQDPYAWKGIENSLSKAFVRPNGDGGCVDWDTKEQRTYEE